MNAGAGSGTSSAAREPEASNPLTSSLATATACRFYSALISNLIGLRPGRRPGKIRNSMICVEVSINFWIFDFLWPFRAPGGFP